MSELSRRNFLGAVTAAAVTGAALPASAAQAADASAQDTQNTQDALEMTRRHGDLRDIKHVVILMQENRSFDHYFGSLRGVRGFGDRSTITLPGGLSVFQQPTTVPGAPITGTQYPWPLSGAPTTAYPAGNQPPSSEVGAQNYGGTAHSWDDQHAAWNGGAMNGWYFAKGGPTTLGYLTRDDIPFHYALADAYTVGDAYHCSVISATGPNRTYLWSATIDAQRKYSNYVAYTGGDEKGLLWPTYAETLENAGVSWKVYQCADNFGDNGLQYFEKFAQLDPSQGGTAAPGNVYYDNGVASVPEPLTGLRANADNIANAIRADVQAGKLPRVSWVVTNKAFSEHPDGAPNDGAYYIEGVLQALAADPKVLNSTLVVVNYDENDGQFDHVPPPIAPAGTTDEYYAETTGPLATAGVTQPLPVGLGFRVPLILVSPWTRGGWVTSEVTDHTSIIQFLERWTEALGTPAVSPNISAWRRTVCGDLLGAFDFDEPVYGLPDLPATTVIGLPSGGAYHPPVPDNEMPTQEAGARPARALPYQPNANLDGVTQAADGSVSAKLSLSNNGPHARKASHFAVYDNTAPAETLLQYPANAPTQYTVAPSSTDCDKSTAATVALGSGSGTAAEKYDLTVIGPNRFLRHFTGDLSAAGKTAQVRAEYYEGGFSARPRLVLTLINDGPHAVTFTVAPNHYSATAAKTYRVAPHSHATHAANPLATAHGWYDVSVTVDGDASWSRRYVGHLENGADSVTG